ncbi:MAG TPA: trehalose-phosphatase [Thermoleophilaceae bacterium]|nr:trehalose-phosphatase [Thermoleophilaceae bacterium]
MTADPKRSALFFDVDGTLAPIVERAQDAAVPKDTSLLLARLSRRYARVACISGRAAADVRRLVGVGGIDYSGLHGAELLEPDSTEARVLPDFARFMPEVQSFARDRDTAELRAMRVRIEDKGPIVTFHWRGAPDEEAAHELVKRLASEAVSEGLWTHWGRKVLEIRPPVPIGKDRAVRELLEQRPVGVALYAGDDVTDLDAFAALAALVDSGELDDAVTVGVSSDEGPREIVEQARIAVDGIAGMQQVLAELDAS